MAKRICSKIPWTRLFCHIALCGMWLHKSVTCTCPEDLAYRKQPMCHARMEIVSWNGFNREQPLIVVFLCVLLWSSVHVSAIVAWTWSEVIWLVCIFAWWQFHWCQRVAFLDTYYNYHSFHFIFHPRELSRASPNDDQIIFGLSVNVYCEDYGCLGIFCTLVMGRLGTTDARVHDWYEQIMLSGS